MPRIRRRSSSVRHGPKLGLRARVTLTFALGAALLSAVLSVTTFGLTRENLLQQREQNAIDQAGRNATQVANSLESTAAPGVARPTDPCRGLNLESLPTPEGAQPLVYLSDAKTWCSITATFGQSAIPEALRTPVADNTAARIRTERDGEPFLIVGIPMNEYGAAYYEGESLSELKRTLEGLGISLIGASALTTLAGGLLGFWAARRVMRPLTDVGRAADAIADGRLDTRLPTGNDPDLDRLATPFNSMASALEERIDRDARFASDVSHELRSPLMTLAASVEVLENCRDDMPDRGKTALDLLSADVDRFQQLVEDLLEISRFDAGAIKLHLEEVLIAEMVIQAVSASRGGGIPVMYDEDVNDVVVRVDKRRFARVLANLIDNAEKYAGGVVAVTMARVDDTVEIAVEDAGPGVPEADRDAIFDRFSRGVEGGNRSTDSGVGLGLALVNEHIRLHGGRVWVEDRPGGQPGARFVVALPIVDLTTPEPTPTHPAEVTL